MESNSNDNNNGGEEQQHQQLVGNARKRTFNELANDVDQPAEEDQQQEPENCSKKKCDGQQGKDALENLESLSREELIELVRKQLVEKNEAQKTTTSQAKEFSQRIVQLEHEKAEQMGETVKMHKEVQEKSEALAEKAKQIDALLMQLNESTRFSHDNQSEVPTDEQQMKIQLSLETWYDWLGFVPRHRLVKIVPKVGDRKFASIAQRFLHEYGEITINCIQIVAPYEEDPDGHPRVRARQLRFEMAETQMPANIKNFNKFELRYFDQSVLNFMQKFKQNGLLDNANLWFDANLSPKDIVQPVLCHLLLLINGIVSIYLMDSAQLVDFYDAESSKEIYGRNMKMMEETRILALDDGDPKSLHVNTIDLYCRWLYQPTRADGKPRVLHILRRDVDYSPISLFIDRLKQDFLMATDPVSFFVQIVLPKAFQPPEAICLDNGETKERFQTEMVEEEPNLGKDKLVLQISRHPLASKKKWIVLGKEYYQKTIYLSKDLKVVPI